MSNYDDRCGAGTGWGCKEAIGDGDFGHCIRDARQFTSGNQSHHVLYHPDCCPCVTDPQAVRSVSVESVTNGPSGRRDAPRRLGAASNRRAS